MNEENRVEKPIERQCKKITCRPATKRGNFMVIIVLYILLAIIIGACRTY